jgi:hypothetical protein
MAFIGLGSLLGIVICLVMLIIKVITKKPKKKIAIALAVCFVLFVVALATPTDNSTADPVKATVEPTPEPTPEPTVEPTPEPTPEPTLEPTSVETIKLLLEGFLAQSFDYYSVEGDETGITINVGMDGVAAEVTAYKALGYDESYESWAQMKEDMMVYYNSTYDLIETLGMKDPLLTVSVVNDQNTENTLLMIMYGVYVYDVMAE